MDAHVNVVKAHAYIPFKSDMSHEIDVQNNVLLLQQHSEALMPQMLYKMATILQDNSIDYRTKIQQLERYERHITELMVMMKNTMKELENCCDAQIIRDETQKLIVFANKIWC